MTSIHDETTLGEDAAVCQAGHFKGTGDDFRLPAYKFAFAAGRLIVSSQISSIQEELGIYHAS